MLSDMCESHRRSKWGLRTRESRGAVGGGRDGLAEVVMFCKCSCGQSGWLRRISFFDDSGYDRPMSRHRLFIALPLPERVRDTLLDVQEGISGARWQDADNFHLTLRFIGEVERHLFADIATALESVPFRRFPLAISGTGHFESKGRGRAIWAGVAPSPPLAELQFSVEMACRRAGLPAEKRKFVPHITLARLNSGSGPIGDWLAAHGDLATGPWQVEGFALWYSDLTANGSLYSRLVEFPDGAPIDEVI